MIYLVYQAYGIDRILQETKFSVLTWLHYMNASADWKIIIYTDNPDYFKSLPVITEKLDKSKIYQWRGELDFVHRLKIKMLQDFFTKYEGDLLYMDSDTYFIQNPKRLLKKIDVTHSLMHLKEACLSDKPQGVMKKVYRFVKKNTFTNPDGKSFNMSLNTDMWNAGVIGLSKKNAFLLDQVLHYSDQWYQIYKKHVMEQFAFSYVLQTNTQLVASDDVIYHYWFSCGQMEPLLTDFFKNNRGLVLTALAEAAVGYKPIANPPAKKPFWKKLFNI